MDFLRKHWIWLVAAAALAAAWWFFLRGDAGDGTKQTAARSIRCKDGRLIEGTTTSTSLGACLIPPENPDDGGTDAGDDAVTSPPTPPVFSPRFR